MLPPIAPYLWRKHPRTCDVKCADLADVFLEDSSPAPTPLERMDLACTIQRAIDDWLEENGKAHG